MNQVKPKVLIVGAGLAGSYLAYLLQSSADITLITKSKATESNSMLAQGGVAISDLDDPNALDEHIKDTLIAGHNEADYCNVKNIIEIGSKQVYDLIKSGLLVDRKANNEIDYAKEGAHSRARVLHIKGDQTGKYLTQFVQSKIGRNVKILENFDILQFNSFDEIKAYFGAEYLVLAMGGSGAKYERTSNSQYATGDAFVLAKRLGLEVKDLDLMQFHPTLLYYDNVSKGLISEAVRGAGAKIINQNGIEIMDGIHQLKSLAPRDIVVKQMQKEIQSGNTLYLDISNVIDFQSRFPTIHDNICKYFDLDEVKNKIPITYGAHFLMGGILVNNVCQTNINNVYAIGECANTQMHGKNRLASNSLLECLATAKICSNSILKYVQ